MLKKYVITYRAGAYIRKVEIDAASKYAAKKIFYLKHPKYEIIKTEEMESKDGKED